MQSHHADRLFKPLGPHLGFTERRTPTYYSVYNSQLEDTLNNTSYLYFILYYILYEYYANTIYILYNMNYTYKI